MNVFIGIIQFVIIDISTLTTTIWWTYESEKKKFPKNLGNILFNIMLQHIRFMWNSLALNYHEFHDIRAFYQLVGSLISLLDERQQYFVTNASLLSVCTIQCTTRTYLIEYLQF